MDAGRVAHVPERKLQESNRQDMHDHLRHLTRARHESKCAEMRLQLVLYLDAVPAIGMDAQQWHDQCNKRCVDLRCLESIGTYLCPCRKWETHNAINGIAILTTADLSGRLYKIAVWVECAVDSWNEVVWDSASSWWSRAVVLHALWVWHRRVASTLALVVRFGEHYPM